MNEQLINFLKDANHFPDLRPENVFGKNFSSLENWCDYVEKIGSIQHLLNKDGDHWEGAADFQKIYVACWIHQPLEKGSFTILLTPQQASNVKKAMERLSRRLSSHLGSSMTNLARSARRGFDFLKGYEELLVQLEKNPRTANPDDRILFLKAEGHAALSISHFKAWIKKRRTGQGLQRSKQLHDLVGHWEFDHRSAENYSKEYEKLLRKGLKLGKSPLIDVQTVIPAICNKLATAEVTVTLENAHLWNKWQAAPSIEIRGLIELIEYVILPTLDRPGPYPKGSIFHALQPAREDLKKIAKQLNKDSQLEIEDLFPRYFQEIRAMPQNLDDSLIKFLNESSKYLQTG